jgi:hypothetical protein
MAWNRMAWNGMEWNEIRGSCKSGDWTQRGQGQHEGVYNDIGMLSEKYFKNENPF